LRHADRRIPAGDGNSGRVSRLLPRSNPARGVSALGRCSKSRGRNGWWANHSPSGSCWRYLQCSVVADGPLEVPGAARQNVPEAILAPLTLAEAIELSWLLERSRSTAPTVASSRAVPRATPHGLAGGARGRWPAPDSRTSRPPGRALPGRTAFLLGGRGPPARAPYIGVCTMARGA
jgi:hypothetical protein